MTFRDPRTWMWANAVDMIDQAERLHRQFFRPAGVASRQPRWEPPVDIVETRDAITIHVALPGVARESVRVFAEGSRLVVTGHRAIPSNSPDAVIHRLEIPYGHFERTIDLGSRQMELGRYEMADGCLVIDLRKLA